jgi:hypothetical protein
MEEMQIINFLYATCPIMKVFCHQNTTILESATFAKLLPNYHVLYTVMYCNYLTHVHFMYGLFYYAISNLDHIIRPHDNEIGQVWKKWFRWNQL